MGYFDLDPVWISVEGRVVPRGVAALAGVIRGLVEHGRFSGDHWPVDAIHIGGALGMECHVVHARSVAVGPGAQLRRGR